MHTLIFSLLEQVMDPSMIALQSPQTTQMPLHTANHSWDASNGLKENHAIHPLTLV